MTATMTETNTRVTVRDGWAVRDLANGDQIRARVLLDQYADAPDRDGVALVRWRDNYGGITLDEHDGLAAILERIGRDGRKWYVSREDDRVWDADLTLEENWARCEHPLDGEAGAEEFVRRYLRAFHGAQHVSLRHHHDYTDWADVWVIVDNAPDVDPGAIENMADAFWSEWDAWASGDVYIIESEYRTLADAMVADDSEDGWSGREYGYVGGYYGDQGARDGLGEALDMSADDVPNPWEVTAP